MADARYTVAVVTEDERPAAWQTRALDALLALEGVRLGPRFAERPGGDVAGIERASGAELLLDLRESRARPLAGTGIACAWSFEHGSDPPGFLESRAGHGVTSARLVETVPSADRVGVLVEGTLRTRSSPSSNREALRAECARWPAQALRERLAGLGPRRHDAPRTPTADPGAGPAEALGRLTRRLRRLADRALRVDHWNVGLVDAPAFAFLDGPPPEVHWLPDPGPTRIQADPFGLVEDGAEWVVYEGLEASEGRGYLARRRVGPGPSFGEEEPLHAAPFHLSYPYLFEHGGRRYCVPETHEAGEIALYRLEEGSASLVRVATLVPDYPGIDATVLRHGDRWWCWATRRDDGHDLRLDLFHAEDPEGPWHPHARNPVKIDVRSARGGGVPFVHDGELYRPGQDYSRKHEERLTLNRVLALSPTEYEEETILTVDPLEEGPYPHKLHTLSAFGSRTLVDGARQVGLWRHPRLAGFKLFRLWRRLSS